MQWLVRMLPFFNRFAKKKPISYFLVLILKNEKANAVIFEEIESKIRVIGQHEEYFKQSIESASPEEFLEALDKTISQAEESLPENIETQKTIFGVKEDWTQNNRIKKEYLLRLKQASDTLELIPIGFLIIPEAVSRLIQKEEGAPISAIFVDCGRKFLTISLIKTGKLVETKTSEIHESIIFTVDTLLKHLELPEILPSRIIISGGNENLTQEFISHQWSKSLPFLHLPQITNLPSDFDAKAVLFGAASQMGFEVLDSNIKEYGEERKETRLTGMEASPDEIKETAEQNPENNFLPTDFGFEKERDIAKVYIEENPNIINNITEENITPIIDKDSLIKNSDSFAFIDMAKKTADKIPSVFKRIFKPKKTLSQNSSPAKILNGKLIFSLLFCIIIILVIILFSVYGSRTTIVLNIKPKTIEQNSNVIFTTSNTESSSPNNIAGQFVTVSENGQISTQTTGKKEVGDKATGTVTIFNALSNDVTLEAGTLLTAPNGLKFTLDQQTVISGVATHSADETPSPITVSAQVTASQVGKDSNLPSGTKFNVESYDITEIVAKNDDPFSGGTDKEITVVSKNDVDKLVEQLPATIEQKAKDDIAKTIPSNQKLLPSFTQVTLTNKEFNGNIGDQIPTLSLKGTVSYEGLSYNQNDLSSVAESLLKNKVPSGLTVDYGNIKVEVKSMSAKSENGVDATVDIKGLLTPKIDENNLIPTLTGKSYKEAKVILSKLPEVSNVKISSSFTFPFLEIISKTPKNIKISANIDD